MVERGANIDIVFRNGLKDYEVLPPTEIWDNIHPVIVRKQRSFIFLRAAALVTVLVSLGVLAYNWSREVTPGLDNSVMVLNMEKAFPVSSPLSERPLIAFTGTENHPENSTVAPESNLQDNKIIPESENGTSLKTVFINEINFLPVKRDESLHGRVIATMDPSQKESIEIMTIDQQYMPDLNPMKGTERWSISALASPTYYSKLSSGNNELSNQLMASEQNIASYSGGVSFAYKVSKRFSVQSGIYYSSVGQMLDGINSYGGFESFNETKGDHSFEVLTTSGPVYTNNNDVFLQASNSGNRVLATDNYDSFDPKKASLQYINNNLQQNFSYLELPVMMRYKFIDNKVDFNLIGGVSYNMLISNSVYAMDNGTKYQIGKTDGLNSFSLSSSFGVGMEYNFSGKFSINLEPTVRYYINPYTNNTGLEMHPYSFGVFSGLSYKF
jgi:hypothetical protein